MGCRGAPPRLVLALDPPLVAPENREDVSQPLYKFSSSSVSSLKFSDPIIYGPFGEASTVCPRLQEMCSGSEAGSYSRCIDSFITQLKAQGPSRTCNEIKEEEKSTTRWSTRVSLGPNFGVLRDQVCTT